MSINQIIDKMQQNIIVQLPDLSTIASLNDHLESILDLLQSQIEKVPQKFKFVYTDNEGDEISVSNEEDFNIYKEYIADCSVTIVPLKVQQINENEEGFTLANNMLDSVDQFACSLHTQMQKLEQFKQNKAPKNQEEEIISQKIEQQMEIYRNSIQEELSNTVKDMVEQKVQEMTAKLMQQNQPQQKKQSPQKKPQNAETTDQQFYNQVFKSHVEKFVELTEIIRQAKSQAEIEHSTLAYWELFNNLRVKLEGKLKSVTLENAQFSQEEKLKRQEQVKAKAQLAKEAEKQKQQAAKELEKQRIQAQRQAERKAEKEAQKLIVQAQKEAERKKQQEQKEASQVRMQEEKQLEKERMQAEKEAEKQQQIEEKARDQVIKQQLRQAKVQRENEKLRVEKLKIEQENKQAEQEALQLEESMMDAKQKQEEQQRSLEQQEIKAIEQELEQAAKIVAEQQPVQQQQQQEQAPKVQALKVQIKTPEEQKLEQLLEIFPKADKAFLMTLIQKNKKANMDELIEKLLYN